jgi:alanine racemase
VQCLSGPRRARFSVDLGAIACNWRLVCDAVPGAAVAAVLKRDAYGLGLETVTPTLVRAGCRRFFVGGAEEGRLLRRLAPGAEIYLIDGLDGARPEDLAGGGMIPVIDSLEALARCGTGVETVALLVDSGIGRIGLTAAEVARLEREPRLLAGRRVALILTYLAGFARPETPENRAQLAAFRELAARLPAAPLSAATSSFAFAGPDWHLDMVRVGSALWGVRTAEVPGYDPAAVVTVEAPVVAVRDIARGDSLGYCRYRAARAMRVATLAIGYSDGLPAELAAGAVVFVGGWPVPLVAEVTMTLSTIDVGGLPPGRPTRGEMVEIVGTHADINALGAALGLNPNRLLAAFGAALPRRYINPSSEAELEAHDHHAPQ